MFLNTYYQGTLTWILEAQRSTRYKMSPLGDHRLPGGAMHRKITIQCNMAKCSHAGVNTVLVGAAAREQVVLTLELESVSTKTHVELDHGRSKGRDWSDVVNGNRFLGRGNKIFKRMDTYDDEVYWNLYPLCQFQNDIIPSRRVELTLYTLMSSGQ